MSEKSYGLAGLEQRCVKPGHWMVEGCDVIRIRHNGEIAWRVVYFGIIEYTGRTLLECREWICDNH